MNRLAPLACLAVTLLPSLATARDYQMEVSPRFRKMGVPDGIIDNWFADETYDDWADGNNPRPSVTAYDIGFEFVIKQPDGGGNGIFYVDYVVSTMEEGYWDDINEEPRVAIDGDYLRPSDNLGLVAIGADFAQEIMFVRSSQTEGKFAMSMLVGGGLGAGILVGKTTCAGEEGFICRWGPEGLVPANQRARSGEPEDEVKEIPGVVPIVDLNLGLRFTFGDRVVLRAEGGLHTMPYYGGTIGVMF